MMKKKTLAFLLAAAILFALTAPVLAAEAVTAKPTSSTVLVNGKSVAFDAYNIGGNNYFKLRDIGKAFDFATDYDAATRTVVIDTGKPYSD